MYVTSGCFLFCRDGVVRLAIWSWSLNKHIFILTALIFICISLLDHRMNIESNFCFKILTTFQISTKNICTNVDDNGNFLTAFSCTFQARQKLQRWTDMVDSTHILLLMYTYIHLHVHCILFNSFSISVLILSLDTNHELQQLTSLNYFYQWKIWFYDIKSTIKNMLV